MILSSRGHEASKNSQHKTTKTTDIHASQRIKDFIVDPGTILFRHETILEAQRHMADKLREIERQVNGGTRNENRT